MTPRRVLPSPLLARVLSHRLHRGEASEPLRAMVRAEGIDWERVLAHASAHLVLPAFAAALRDLDLLQALDAELGAFLIAVHAANKERNRELRGEVEAAVGILNRAGIEPVLLKGAIRLAEPLYPDHGWRMLRDLDLLVPHTALATALRALERAGYSRCGLHYEMRRPEGPCQIDLHTEVFSGSTRPLLPASQLREASHRTVLAGGRARVPAVDHQLVHLIGHSQIRHRGHAAGHLGLQDLLETAALVGRWHGCIDWRAITSCFAAAGCGRPLLSFQLALNDGGWCTVPLSGRVDPLTALQRRRVLLQTRSSVARHIGSRVGWWLSELADQFTEREAGQRRAIRNLRRLVRERGALRRMARAVLERRHHLVHALPPLSLFSP